MISTVTKIYNFRSETCIMKKNNKILIGIGVVLATVAVIFFQKKKKEADNLPPKKAPQLPIDNPGEQSEFTTSASESEIG